MKSLLLSFALLTAGPAFAIVIHPAATDTHQDLVGAIWAKVPTPRRTFDLKRAVLQAHRSQIAPGGGFTRERHA